MGMDGGRALRGAGHRNGPGGGAGSGALLTASATPDQGAGPESQRVLVKISAAPISISDCESLAAISDGALVLFAGKVRSESQGRAVLGLDYEAYERLAVPQMREIAREALKTYNAGAVCLLHRTGQLVVGETSVVAGVSAPHRQDAFAACKFCIDSLKQRVAIWKKEIFADGRARWVEHA